MCVTVFQVVYVAGLAISFSLTAASIALPNWLEEEQQNSAFVRYTGLFKTCIEAANDSNFSKCKAIWQELKDVEKAGIICLILAVALCVFASAWAMVAYYGCCCRGVLTQPLPYVTALAFVFDLAGLICITHDQDIGQYSYTDQAKIGMSLWLAFTGLIVLLADTIVAIGLALSSQFCPC
ncbi:protein clc; protein cbr clc-4; protein cbr clc-1; cre clc-4 protein; cre clc-1 protein; cbn clc-4 protein; cbn clc-1 protein [Trichuris trichiura]|uniref:Protein clc protein cbr clc-4 protein cbr clc-1 cre clc-4 protein cre clc-1 protein cbn clc-4 protein cbn clc-1 protein n=1 Tax=Trichuris trichiura TaxID=36087 RepID=A0A077ZPB0_TRITR|nr:protein clc; protein cbr clc-4; protein cbr clc-1; cre clc-4 protein; cre clc-1 protein; cbn clc-4 protein; cbn clc-1 protein [Trichuris trichiura]